MNTLALLLGAAFTTWWVDPYGDVPYLPDAEPHGGVVTNVLSCAAAKGEIETISFSVQPSRDLKKVDFRPSDLTGPGGAKIPAACADFAIRYGDREEKRIAVTMDDVGGRAGAATMASPS